MTQAETSTCVTTCLVDNNDHDDDAGNGEVPLTNGTSSLSVRTVQTRRADNGHPMIHAPVDAPLCSNCRQIGLEFFDPSCPGCRAILLDTDNTTVAQILALMRQWVPQTQRSIDVLVSEALRRNAHPNDRDGLTDLTLLHYACRAGASGVGDGAAATRAVRSLLSLGADPNLTCRWTQLSSLQYAAYFDASTIVHLLLETAPDTDINATCPGYDCGAALHIAASNLCLETTRVLLRHGAKLTIKDSLGRFPKDCVPDAAHFDNIKHVQEVISMLKRLLTVSDRGNTFKGKLNGQTMEPVSGRALLKSMGLNIGSRVLVAGLKSGTLRFCGTTEFAVGLWIGVELDSPDGKNDGSINGVSYFRSRLNHGIFVPINKISRLAVNVSSPSLTRNFSRSLTTSPVVVRQHHARLDFSKITSKIETGLVISPKTSIKNSDLEMFKVGDRVLIAGKRKGTIRFYGPTKFAIGHWYGIELDMACGKNDGCVEGVRYFTCGASYGVFASPAKVAHLLTSSDDCISEIDSSGDGTASSDAMTTSNSSSTYMYPNRRAKTCSPARRSPLRMSFRIKSPSKSPRTVNMRSPAGFNLSSPFLHSDHKDNFCLIEGVSVLVNNELGIVRYVGHVEFEEGLWVGVELRLPRGKNDGTVCGKQYFVCKANHGLLVRPQKVTVHGINGSKLIPESLRPVTNGTT